MTPRKKTPFSLHQKDQGETRSSRHEEGWDVFGGIVGKMLLVWAFGQDQHLTGQKSTHADEASSIVLCIKLQVLSSPYQIN